MASIREALAQANKGLQSKIDAALTKEVYGEVVLTEYQAVYGRVYSTKTSGDYQRRYGNHGLGDPENMEIVGGKASGGRLEVANVTKTNPFKNGVNADAGISKNGGNLFLAPIVESGSGYDWADPGPRPFLKLTREVLGNTGAHVDALRRGLKRQGIKVEE